MYKGMNGVKFSLYAQRQYYAKDVQPKHTAV